MSKKKTNFYLCNKCSAIVERESGAATIKSFCSEFGNKPSILRIVKSEHDLAKKLRRRFLKNILALETFSKKDRMLLNIAWEQGSVVTFNRIHRK